MSSCCFRRTKVSAGLPPKQTTPLLARKNTTANEATSLGTFRDFFKDGGTVEIRRGQEYLFRSNASWRMVPTGIDTKLQLKSFTAPNNSEGFNGEIEFNSSPPGETTTHTAKLALFFFENQGNSVTETEKFEGQITLPERIENDEFIAPFVKNETLAFRSATASPVMIDSMVFKSHEADGFMNVPI